MIVSIASDHRGFLLKKSILKKIFKDIKFLDLGTNSEESVDFPDFALKCAKSFQNQECERIIMICGSGIGASIALNKFKGIRASVCHDTYSAHQGVEHDDMNALALGANIVGENLALEIVDSFLKARFLNEERFLRRLNKITDFELSFFNHSV